MWVDLRRVTLGGLLLRAGLLSFVGGCGWSDLLASPYVVTTGLDHVGLIDMSDRDSLLVPTAKGLLEVTAEGKQVVLWSTPAEAVCITPDAWVVVSQGRVFTGHPVVAGASYAPEELPPPIAGAPLIKDAAPDGIGGAWTIDADGRLNHRPDPGDWEFEGGRSFVRGMAGQVPWIAADDGVYIARAVGVAPYVNLPNLQSAAVDAMGVVYAVSGSPPQLASWATSAWKPVQAHLTAPRSLVFGRGRLLKAANLYVADASGSVDYVHLGPD